MARRVHRPANAARAVSATGGLGGPRRRRREAHEFDDDTATLRGSPIVLVPSISRASSGRNSAHADFWVSRSGVLAFRSLDTEGLRRAAIADTFATALKDSVAHAFAGHSPTSSQIDRYVDALHLEDLALAVACAQGREATQASAVRIHAEDRPTRRSATRSRARGPARPGTPDHRGASTRTRSTGRPASSDCTSFDPDHY